MLKLRIPFRSNLLQSLRALIPGDRRRALARSLRAFIPDDRRRALARGEALPDRVQGAALFADISGFTPLTEALAKELGAHRGAEELTKHLTRVFHGVISDLHRFGGTVIYFSGDAITCWFDGDDGSRATSCGLMMQDTMQRLHEIVTPGGTRVTLATKVSVAVGPARRFVVGDPELQLIDVLAGRLVDYLAAAEHHAAPGEVVLDESALRSLGSRVTIGEMRTDQSGARHTARCAAVLGARATDRVARADDDSTPLPHGEAKRWLWPSVYERLSSGSGEFLTELRPAYSVFARFGGIDYDEDDAAPAKLDAFVRAVQRVFFAYDGTLVHLSVGDKGAYLYGVFGSPNAHENDAARASAAALELRDVSQATAVTELQIGVTYGRLRSGTCGHERRQAFTCLGDSVNLAARLMSHAPQGRIYASSEVHAAARDGFIWSGLEPIRVKGKREPVAAFELTASRKRAERRSSSGELPMIGRNAEFAELAAHLDAALAGNGSVIAIAAEAGMGKSRLIAEFVKRATTRDILVASGECQAYGSRTSYFVWRDIWHKLFGLEDSFDHAAKIERVERELAAIDPALVPRAPLLAGVLDTAIPDSELTAAFDAKLRKASLEALLADCLRARARERPLVIVLEDCHWLDALSRDLLEVLARSLPEQRCLFVVAYRPGKDSGGGLGLQKLEHFDEVALTELDATQTSALISLKVKQMLGTEAEPPAALAELITARAQGNPFYIEELLNYIRAKGVDLENASSLKSIELPGSLHSLILSRIDALGEDARHTLKVASVIGRVFRAPMLRRVYPELGSLKSITKQLATLGGADLVHPEIEEEQSYIFKHAVTQEVAYESMPFAFRSTLHERVGRFIERAERDAIDRHLDLLAHHYWHSENVAKKREYLGRAGNAAQAAYANAAAIDYFERLVPLLEGAERVDALIKLGKVLELVGNYKRAEEIHSQALALAVSLDHAQCKASCEAALAEAVRKLGRLDEALERLGRAAVGYKAVNDQSGVGYVHHLLGTIAGQRGDYDNAVYNYEVSLGIREKLGDTTGAGSLLSNLGVIAEYRGDYDASRAFHDRALALRTDAGDRWGIARSLTNLGMIALLQKRYDEARDLFQRSMQLGREIGDAWIITLSSHNLGNTSRALGDFDTAKKYYAECLRKFADDPWALAFLLEDIGVLSALAGDARSALEVIGAADALRDANSMPRGPAIDQEIDAHLAPAASTLPPEEAFAFRAAGRALDRAAAVQKAFAVCTVQSASAAAASKAQASSAVAG